NFFCLFPNLCIVSPCYNCIFLPSVRSRVGGMEFGEETSPALVFDKDAFDLTVEDVYDISYVIGRDLLKISGSGEEVSDLQFRIVRVLEMFETLVNKYNLSLEELRMERDNLKGELQKVLSEQGASREGTTVGPNQLVVDLTDPNRPRFTMQELKEVLQERNQLKAQLMVAQEELQLYKSGILPNAEAAMVEVDLDTPPASQDIFITSDVYKLKPQNMLPRGGR
uniref:RILP-like protein 2 n=1 Tax=Periophthalmus magnuspinnatus TaxID=409849 RepID=A0A3B4AZH2_9GOBI